MDKHPLPMRMGSIPGLGRVHVPRSNLLVCHNHGPAAYRPDLLQEEPPQEKPAPQERVALLNKVKRALPLQLGKARAAKT